MICRDCGLEFWKEPGSPGYINQCLECEDDVEKVAGRIVGSGRDAPAFEVTSQKIVRATRGTKFGLSVGMVTPPPTGRKVITWRMKNGKRHFHSREE